MHSHFDTDLMDVNTPYPWPACWGQTIITLNLILILFVALNLIEIKVNRLQCSKGDNKEN